MIPGSDIVRSDWLPGPSEATNSRVVVSFTDFHSDSEADWQQIAAVGMKLAESWPIMRGAVGLWLWGKQVELRGGSLAVWDSHADLRRFVGWPVHVAIMNNWRERIRVHSAKWYDELFIPTQVWKRAEALMLASREV